MEQLKFDQAVGNALCAIDVDNSPSTVSDYSTDAAIAASAIALLDHCVVPHDEGGIAFGLGQSCFTMISINLAFTMRISLRLLRYRIPDPIVSRGLNIFPGIRQHLTITVRSYDRPFTCSLPHVTSGIFDSCQTVTDLMPASKGLRRFSRSEERDPDVVLPFDIEGRKYRFLFA